MDRDEHIDEALAIVPPLGRKIGITVKMWRWKGCWSHSRRIIGTPGGKEDPKKIDSLDLMKSLIIFFRVFESYRWTVVARRRIFPTFGCLLLALAVGGALIVRADEQNTETADVRTWTTRDGQQFDGKFLGRLSNAVRIENRSGEEQTLDYLQLIEEDQQFIDQIISQLKSADEQQTDRRAPEATDARTWCDINGRNFRAELVTLDGSEVEFNLADENRKIRMETLLLSRQDIDHILNRLNQSLPTDQRDQRFRVWSYQDANQNESRMIGLYVGLNQENLILNQPHGVRTIPIARLKPWELDYIVEIDNSTRGAIDPIRNSNDWELLARQKQNDFSSGVPSLSPMWWFSLGLIFLLMLGLISVKYIYESSQPEFDDDF